MAVTDNMSLPILESTDSSGELITKINQAFTLISLHTHISGEGLKVPFSALFANTNLNFLEKNIENINQVEFAVLDDETLAENNTIFLNDNKIKFKDSAGIITNLGQASVPTQFGSDFPNSPKAGMFFGIISSTTRPIGIYWYDGTNKEWKLIAGLGGQDDRFEFVNALPTQNQDINKYYVLREASSDGSTLAGIYIFIQTSNSFKKLFGNQNADEISVSTSSFNKNLKTEDNTAQKAFNRLNLLNLGRNYIVSALTPINPTEGTYIKYSEDKSGLSNHFDENNVSITTAKKGAIFVYNLSKWKRIFEPTESTPDTPSTGSADGDLWFSTPNFPTDLSSVTTLISFGSEDIAISSKVPSSVSAKTENQGDTVVFNNIRPHKGIIGFIIKARVNGIVVSETFLGWGIDKNTTIPVTFGADSEQISISEFIQKTGSNQGRIAFQFNKVAGKNNLPANSDVQIFTALSHNVKSDNGGGTSDKSLISATTESITPRIPDFDENKDLPLTDFPPIASGDLDDITLTYLYKIPDDFDWDSLSANNKRRFPLEPVAGEELLYTIKRDSNYIGVQVSYLQRNKVYRNAPKDGLDIPLNTEGHDVDFTAWQVGADGTYWNIIIDSIHDQSVETQYIGGSTDLNTLIPTDGKLIFYERPFSSTNIKNKPPNEDGLFEATSFSYKGVSGPSGYKGGNVQRIQFYQSGNIYTRFKESTDLTIPTTNDAAWVQSSMKDYSKGSNLPVAGFENDAHRYLTANIELPSFTLGTFKDSDVGYSSEDTRQDADGFFKDTARGSVVGSLADQGVEKLQFYETPAPTPNATIINFKAPRLAGRTIGAVILTSPTGNVHSLTRTSGNTAVNASGVFRATFNRPGGLDFASGDVGWKLQILTDQQKQSLFHAYVGGIEYRFNGTLKIWELAHSFLGLNGVILSRQIPNSIITTDKIDNDFKAKLIPAGGTAGQVVGKTSATKVGWITPSSAGNSNPVGKLIATTTFTIPQGSLTDAANGGKRNANITDVANWSVESDLSSFYLRGNTGNGGSLKQLELRDTKRIPEIIGWQVEVIQGAEKYYGNLDFGLANQKLSFVSSEAPPNTGTGSFNFTLTKYSNVPPNLRGTQVKPDEPTLEVDPKVTLAGSYGGYDSTNNRFTRSPVGITVKVYELLAGAQGPAGKNASGGVTTFKALTDTPNTLTEGKFLKADASGNLVETDAPSSGSGSSNASIKTIETLPNADSSDFEEFEIAKIADKFYQKSSIPVTVPNSKIYRIDSATYDIILSLDATTMISGVVSSFVYDQNKRFGTLKQGTSNVPFALVFRADNNDFVEFFAVFPSTAPSSIVINIGGTEVTIANGSTTNRTLNGSTTNFAGRADQSIPDKLSSGDVSLRISGESLSFSTFKWDLVKIINDYTAGPSFPTTNLKKGKLHKLTWGSDISPIFTAGTFPNPASPGGWSNYVGYYNKNSNGKAPSFPNVAKVGSVEGSLGTFQDFIFGRQPGSSSLTFYFLCLRSQIGNKDPYAIIIEEENGKYHELQISVTSDSVKSSSYFYATITENDELFNRLVAGFKMKFDIRFSDGTYLFTKYRSSKIYSYNGTDWDEEIAMNIPKAEQKKLLESSVLKHSAGDELPGKLNSSQLPVTEKLKEGLTHYLNKNYTLALPNFTLRTIDKGATGFDTATGFAIESDYYKIDSRFGDFTKYGGHLGFVDRSLGNIIHFAFFHLQGELYLSIFDKSIAGKTINSVVFNKAGSSALTIPRSLWTNNTASSAGLLKASVSNRPQEATQRAEIASYLSNNAKVSMQVNWTDNTTLFQTGSFGKDSLYFFTGYHWIRFGKL